MYLRQVEDFSPKNFDYSAIGDTVEDDNDLSDRLSIELKLTKSATSNAFNFVATLNNLDTSQSVALISDTISQSGAYTSDLLATSIQATFRKVITTTYLIWIPFTIQQP